ncbi:large ribosomal subunit protein P2A-like [Phragmites australis]|uniref:large ribosomal subunit protein P2A-like n=1 Tax=Phragmites australis TaxID=29695 RepID=UPI002D78B5D4|nr:large ribosomal subunit protein P2A-like [Phragmites australis]
MKFVASYLLAVLSGNSSPSAEDLTAILESVGCEIDNEKMELLLSQLSGKDITELIAAGREKFASVPCGGGGGVAVAAAPAAAGAGAAPAAEAKKEEKVEEKEESDDDMGFSLFD